MRIFAVVGPSGAGKDSLLAAVAQRLPDIIVVRRTITRPNATGDEPHLPVDEGTFSALKAQGAFALSWTAHGMHYGLPRSMVDHLTAGKTLVFNGSRDALKDAFARFPALEAIYITAPQTLLEERLRTRGREAGQDRSARLHRKTAPFPPELPVHTVTNDGEFDDALNALIAVLEG